MIAFVESHAPFFTWTGAVFVAAVAIGLVLWAGSGLWRWLVATGKRLFAPDGGIPPAVNRIERRTRQSVARQVSKHPDWRSDKLPTGND